jgi:hypothetical protein
MGASAALQSGLFTAINALGYTTYTVRPQASDGAATAVFPHVQLGTIVLNENDTDTTDGFDFVARIHTRWRGGSELVGKAIQDAIYGALHNGSLTVTGWSKVLIQRRSSDVTRLEDGSFHGVCEYRGLITEA